MMYILNFLQLLEYTSAMFLGIHSHYYSGMLQVYLEIPRGKKITAKIPILVGTIPFDQKIDEYIESWGKDKQFVNSDNQHHQISQEAPRELN